MSQGAQVKFCPEKSVKLESKCKNIVVLRAVSELQEVIDTNIIVRELFGENRRITCVLPYPEDAVRHMLYTRFFNNGNGPPDLSSDDAAEMFVYRENFITRLVVRHELLAIVDSLWTFFGVIWA